MFWRNEKEEEQAVSSEVPTDATPPIDQKPFWQVIWPVLACGAGLFSDGYVNNVYIATSLSPSHSLFSKHRPSAYFALRRSSAP